MALEWLEFRMRSGLEFPDEITAEVEYSKATQDEIRRAFYFLISVSLGFFRKRVQLSTHERQDICSAL